MSQAPNSPRPSQPQDSGQQSGYLNFNSPAAAGEPTQALPRTDPAEPAVGSQGRPGWADAVPAARYEVPQRPPQQPEGQWPGPQYPAPAQPAGPGGPVPPGGGTPTGGSGGPQKRRLPGFAIALIALAAVVVLGVVGFIAVDSLGSARGSDSAGTAPSAQAPAAGDDENAGQSDEGGLGAPDEGQDVDKPADLTSFHSPSGNITCEIGDSYARCLINTVQFTPDEAPEQCQAANYGKVLVATDAEVGFNCHDTSMPSGGSELGYDDSITKSGMKCTSSQTGVSCYATESGRGFSVAQAGIGWKR
ncbi:hypothetical protein NQ038_07050 [Brevibacterium sp. 50QC2O2]|uniref:hypothetical protein n=1 Tax=Brevibacterium TaxID=1696 RepID=UPI00211C9D7D|nr:MULTISPECIES: hypothetical protein [unclassified Brevibacterium]MCQ9366968.1 hypothetical protein [Brevibacterium sp. 91QC2O2]MCQ9384117.1 hypothetical protein [Brevibacterium sp. 68QC2CO]MCQ9388405.1 hypothetical protein [Brevibacterium sp. 50QC2O2]